MRPSHDTADLPLAPHRLMSPRPRIYRVEEHCELDFQNSECHGLMGFYLLSNRKFRCFIPQKAALRRLYGA